MRLRASKGDILIIGGGASGLAAACVALQAGARVTLLEARDRVGKKLLATGNGRCNLLNTGAPIYFGDPAFACSVLAACPVERVLAFFHRLGLTTVEEESGLVYPGTYQAASVLEVLRAFLDHSPGFRLVTNAEAVDVQPRPGGFVVHTRAGEQYAASRVLAAAGGPAQPRLSGTDSLFAPLKRLGHTLVQLRPALTGIETDPADVRGLKGMRLPALCTLCGGDDRPVCASAGEVIFSDTGISGICVMQISRDAGQLLQAGDRPTLYLDMSPLLGLEPRLMQRMPVKDPRRNHARVLALLQQRVSDLPSGQALTGLLPRLLQDRLRGLDLHKLAAMLCAMPLRVQAVRGWDQAQVAAGGIDTADVEVPTMESKLVPGLHLAGELLNVDGDCGGYNLLFAWATGILAGTAMAAEQGN
jgi:predicted Rossmann fold flavoprotein